MAIPPAGLTPAGFFVPQTFADPSSPPGILADAIDPETGEYLSISRGIDPIDEQVLVALTLRRRSGAACMDDGNDFAGVRKVDDSARTVIDAEARRALARLATAGDIKVRKVYAVADPDTDWGEVAVEYENTRAVSNRRRVAMVIP
jgi:hypothetical protein